MDIKTLQAIILFCAIWLTIAIIRYLLKMIVKYDPKDDDMVFVLSFFVSYMWSLFYLIC